MRRRCRSWPWKGNNLADWIWSTAWYAAALVALAGVIGMVKPLRWLHARSRRRAAMMVALAIAAMITMALATPAARTSSGPRAAIDEFAPQFHFVERHQIIIAAPPARVFDAIKAVTADEIALFTAFTSIRRLGRSGPESILNAPGSQPILDVAVKTGFLLLRDDPPRGVIVGAVVVAPPGTRGRPGFSPEDFKQLQSPGFAKATMGFSVSEGDAGSSRVVTETRVFATDQTALRRFTPYWRIVFPGSAILRTTWLRATKARAERAAS